jgi:hypothetical protein
VLDVAITLSDRPRGGWEVSALAIGRSRGLRRQPPEIVPWYEHRELFEPGGLADQLAELRDIHPADMANAVEAMPATRRSQLAELLRDEELADLLEEMPEQDQVRLLAGLGLERTADIVEEMQPDDAADLLAEMPAEYRERLLGAMRTTQAADLRRLLGYDATTRTRSGGCRRPSPAFSARAASWRARPCWSSGGSC